MTTRARVLAALGLAWATGCIDDRGFPCARNEQCALDGVQGRCEPPGWCSYPDEACDTNYRFESLAGDALGGACVGLCGAAALVAGARHTCVLDGSGVPWCWGANGSAQLGLGSISGQQDTPRVAGGLRALGGERGQTLVTLAASEHGCGLDAEGSVWCWGDNARGQVSLTAQRGPPVQDPVRLDLPAQQYVGVGPRLSCAGAGAQLTCWGELGVAASPGSIDAEAQIQDIAVGDRHGCVRTSQTRVYCLGDVTRLGGPASVVAGGLPVAIPLGGGALALDAGADHTCAVTLLGDGNEVVCWGLNDRGQCGLPGPELVQMPTPVPSLSGATYLDLALGAAHACVLRQDGHVLCWGDGSAGQVLVGSTAVTPEPEEVRVDGAPLLALEIAAGDAHTCARTASKIVCWGDNGFSQLGTGDTALKVHRVPLDCR